MSEMFILLLSDKNHDKMRWGLSRHDYNDYTSELVYCTNFSLLVLGGTDPVVFGDMLHI